MASDAAIFVRIDSNVKKDAETILRQLGVTPSSLITMLYHNVILTGGIPFDVRLPVREPINETKLSEEELDALLKDGLDDIKAGRVYSAEQVEEMLKNRHK